MDTSSRDDFFPEEQTPRPYKAAIVADLIELDRDIMKLLVRRAKLVGKLRGGKDHAATPAAARAEKEVRAAWEKNAVSFSRDDKFARQLFSLLQELRMDSRRETEERGGFNLSPARKAVSVNIPGPVSVLATRMLAAFAAFSGGGLTLANAVFNDPLMDCVKALNSAGAKFTWTVGARPGEGTLTHSGPADVSLTTDRALYIGEDLLNAYLLAFLAAGKVGKARFTGGAGLKMADLSPLRRFLPELGARLAHSVPKSNGLPANVESSGVVPDSLIVPGDLPKEGVIALLTAAAVWRKQITLDFAALPATLFSGTLAGCLPTLRACGVTDSLQGTVLNLDARAMALPSEAGLAVAAPLDPVLGAYLLALPAFAGGRVALAGRWDAALPFTAMTEALLNEAGLAVHGDASGVSSAQAEAAPGTSERLDLASLDGSLLPLGIALAVRNVRRSKGAMPLPLLPEGTDTTLIESFCARFGVACHDGSLLPQEKGEAGTESVPWTSPAPVWSFAYALCSFLRANVRLTNPTAVGALMPSFWSLFNALPDPSEAKKAPEEPKTARRRIITS